MASDLATLSSKLLEAVNKHCVEAYSDGPKWRLGASVIGNDCKRYLWYLFRWINFEQKDARTLRLLNRGEREEARFSEWLQGIGCQLWAFDENGKQYKISGANGHFGGSVDAVIRLPDEFNFSHPLIASFKTNGTGKGFNGLFDNGVAKHKPLHWAQECAYGFKMQIEYVAYFNINKNDDDLFVEIAKLDHKLGRQMEEKANIIISSQVAPAKLSENPNHFACGTCSMKGVCHNGEQPNKNCRSCANAKPVENAEWHCLQEIQNIPRHVVESFYSCKNWKAITE